MQCASSNANNDKKKQIEKRLKQLQSMYDAGEPEHSFIVQPEDIRSKIKRVINILKKIFIKVF